MKNKREDTFIITEIGNGAYKARKMAEESETESVPQPAPHSPPNQSQPEPKGNWFIKFESIKRVSKIGTEDDLICHNNGRGTPLEAYITLYGHQRSIIMVLKFLLFKKEKCLNHLQTFEHRRTKHILYLE